MPHEITQCYLPPGKNDIPALVCLTYSCAGTACVCVCGKCKLRVSSCVRAGLQADRQTDTSRYALPEPSLSKRVELCTVHQGTLSIVCAVRMESESSRFTDELNIYRSYLDRAAPRRRWSNTGRARSMQSHSKKGSTYSITYGSGADPGSWQSACR